MNLIVDINTFRFFMPSNLSLPYPIIITNYRQGMLSKSFIRVAGFTAQKMKFSLRIYSINVTKSSENCGFGHIY